MKERSAVFFKRLEMLGTGDRAALKRSAGLMLADADGKAISAFYRCLPSAVYQEDRWFAVACLRCLWDPGEFEGEPFEKILSQMVRDDKISGSTLHRVEMLLDTAWDNDGYMLTKLTRLIKLIRQKSDRAPIDFGALLEDLLGWNHENQYVQRKWARSIFANIEN